MLTHPPFCPSNLPLVQYDMTAWIKRGVREQIGLGTDYTDQESVLDMSQISVHSLKSSPLGVCTAWSLSTRSLLKRTSTFLGWRLGVAMAAATST